MSPSAAGAIPSELARHARAHLAGVPPSGRDAGLPALVVTLFLLGIAPVVAARLFEARDLGLLAGWHLAMTAVLAAVLARRHGRAAVLVLTMILLWQPLFTMPLSATLGNSGTQLFVATKEIFVAVLLAVLWLRNDRKVRWNYVDLLAFGFVAVQIFYFLVSPAPLFARLTSMREGMMVVMLYLTGRLFLFDWQDLRWVLKGVIAISGLAIAFGVIERFVFTTDTWLQVGAMDYFGGKYADWQPNLVNGLPAQWHTFIGGELIRRMVGPLGYAIAFSRYLVLPTLALVYIPGLLTARPQGRPVELTLFALCCVGMGLTLGRGGIVIALGGMLVLTYVRNRALALWLAAPAVILAVSTLALFDAGGGVALRHLAGLAGGTAGLLDAPFGHGLGTSGQLAVLYGGEVDDSVTESYFGGLAYQMGVIGLAFFYALSAALVLALWRAHDYLRAAPQATGRADRITLLAFSATGGALATSVLGNAAVSPVSIGLALILAGACLTARDRTIITRARPTATITPPGGVVASAAAGSPRPAPSPRSIAR